MARTKKIAKPVLPEPPPVRVVDHALMRLIRDKAELTQFDLALLTGVSPRTISRIESGKHDGSPSLADVGRIADVLLLPLDTLAPKRAK